MNEENFRTFWYWINTRHNIYLKKQANEPKPWSDDPIFQDWKFCNIFRRLDRISDYLIKNVIEPHWEDDPALILFNIFAFRAFNWPETYEWMGGWQDDWHLPYVQDSLRKRARDEYQMFSPAYIIRGSTGEPKWKTISNTLNQIWLDKDVLADYILRNPRLESAFDLIMAQKYWCWGQFTTYQVVLDLTYSPILMTASDINTWCSWGNGALKGLRRIWPDMKPTEALEKMRWLQAESPKYLESHMPMMNLQDIEFSLCELSKYLTIKDGGKMKMRYPGRA